MRHLGLKVITRIELELAIMNISNGYQSESRKIWLKTGELWQE